jgi:hypothetical protein
MIGLYIGILFFTCTYRVVYIMHLCILHILSPSHMTKICMISLHQLAKMLIPRCLSDMMTLMLHKEGTSLNKGFSVVDPPLFIPVHFLSVLEPRQVKKKYKSERIRLLNIPELVLRIWIRIHRIHIFLGLLDQDPDP